MRFVFTAYLTTEMTLAKSIFNDDGTLLLRKNTKLKDTYISKIKSLKMNGVYIEDEISKDLEINDIMSDDIRFKAKQTIKAVFSQADSNIHHESSVNKSIKEATDIIESIIDNLVDNDTLMINMIDIKSLDDYTFSHSVNVATLALMTGMKLKLNKQALYELGLGAFLHDLGKVAIPKNILNKPAKLNDDEVRVIQEHSKLGYSLLRNQSLPSRSLAAILEHHEKFDGTGYPNKKKGKEISLFGRIIAVCDVYDALTSKRVYKPPMLSSLAMEYIMGGSNTHFDPEIIKAFCSAVAMYPLGAYIITNDGRKGVVIGNKPSCVGRPIIKLEDNSILDLTSTDDNLNITVEEIMR